LCNGVRIFFTPCSSILHIDIIKIRLHQLWQQLWICDSIMHILQQPGCRSNFLLHSLVA
jgi:hypothetical protein